MSASPRSESKYEAFNVVIHGVLMIELDLNAGKTTLFLPEDPHHRYIAAYVDVHGFPLKQWSLQQRSEQSPYSIANVRSHSKLKVQHPRNPDCLVVREHPIAKTKMRCQIDGLPLPERLSPWRKFSGPVLDSKDSSTYRENQLANVNRAGIPTIYILHYGEQKEMPVFVDGSISWPIHPTDGVGRLHIFAEAPVDHVHDAFPTLNGCGNPQYDLQLAGGAPDGLAPWEKPPLESVAMDEQRALCECVCCEHAPAHDKGHVFHLEDRNRVFDNNPRACIPMVALKKLEE